MNDTGIEFKSKGDGTCKIVVNENFAEEILHVPEKNHDGDEIIAICVKNACVKKIFLPATIESVYEDYRSAAEIIFSDGLKSVRKGAFFGVYSVTFPATLTDIDEDAFEFDEYSCGIPTIRAPKNSAAHRLAVKKDYRYMPTDCLITWDAKSWQENFRADGADYRALRREVWENTRAIVEDNGYTLTNGNSVLLRNESDKRYSQFYYEPFRASFEKLTTPPEITVVSDDCLDVAHKWVNDGLEVSVLNMASRQNPGGGVLSGAGAQEEYLFRCSDYYKFLYRYASYAEQYGLTRSHYQYPLDKNFGGIFSAGVMIFRENEAQGYRLTEKPWKVNMIAVAGMNSPRLIWEGGEERIAPELVEGVKNKLRTIFRIACDRGQRNLVLGAIGCGAFHNPPKHVAELFREILCEQEFFGAFKKICFAVKTSHTSKGDTNFSAFKENLDGFIPTLKSDLPDKTFELSIKKIAIARDSYALLKTNGQVEIIDIHKGKARYSRRFRKSVDIAGGFHHIVGLREDSSVVFKSVGSQAPNHHGIHWFGGIAVDACEMHSAMLRRDGTVLCVDHSYKSKIKLSENPSTFELIKAAQEAMVNVDIPHYKKIVESWRNIKQVALTFETPYALTHDGKVLCGDRELEDFQEPSRGKIVQIAAFGCYYSTITIAALYENGTVKAWCDTDITEIAHWQGVKKICCGNHAAVIGLTDDGKVLLPDYCKYKDRSGNKVKGLENIADIAANFGHLIALNRTGEIIYLRN